jgi:hypothetical protein
MRRPHTGAGINGGIMRNPSVLIGMGLFALLVCGTVHAQQLPKSGSINFHTGWKDTSDAIEVADKRYQGAGRAVGTPFNDKGSGPLHLGPANCSTAFSVTEGSGPLVGYCTFSDAEGDRVFTDVTGTISPQGAEGTNKISGGTGKYAGISGAGPWKCKASGKNGELQCAQRLDYRLP